MVPSQLSPPPLFPPPLPLPPPPSLRPILYYFLVVVATATLALALYSVIILRWCSEQQQQQQQRRHPSRAQSSVDDHLTASNFRVISSFKFKKEMDYMVHDHEQGYEPPECSICLSVFEEDDELKRLPRCMHCFHANCIDKWLISHLNCPLCRLDVVESTRSKEANQPGNSHVVIVLPVHR